MFSEGSFKEHQEAKSYHTEHAPISYSRCKKLSPLDFAFNSTGDKMY